MRKFLQRGGAFLLTFGSFEFIHWYSGANLFERSTGNAFALICAIIVGFLAQWWCSSEFVK